ncbi:hypothetical protein JR316_0008279 [Psilocybe cubensis]|uniref:F-box domain-containing protein n=2 Tax=Psilocybe cubensis TaxID=181762 RepID=A0A8H8CIY3_PSICU|nr:hypothetical protein JR316_0008279 [Psilocybe cubensis]KAH9479684.1 hypothetical protein JR316_0008279 [Psilocybe cubensis]
MLPNETLSAIFHELPPSSLAAAARASVRFNAVAERILYSSIYIHDLLLPLRTLKWCAAMRTRPHLFESVKRLHIRWQHAPPDPASSSSSVAPPGPSTAAIGPEHSRYWIHACEQLALVLPLLTELESLDLFLGPANLAPYPAYDDIDPDADTEKIHAIERVVRGCSFPHLRACTLGADSAKGAQPYTRVLVDFLGALPALRHLRLSDLASHHHQYEYDYAPPHLQFAHTTLGAGGGGGPPNYYAARTARLDSLPSTALPLLTSFRGSADAAAALLPGRPVQFLALVGQDSDVTRENLPRLTQTSLPLRYLDLSAMSVRPVLLRNVSAWLPTVETLRVKLALRHTLHYSFSGIRILAGLSAVLAAFPHLTHLDLSPTGIDGVGRADAREEHAVCTEWARACPTLRRVVFPSGTEWVWVGAGGGVGAGAGGAGGAGGGVGVGEGGVEGGGGGEGGGEGDGDGDALATTMAMGGWMQVGAGQ